MENIKELISVAWEFEINGEGDSVLLVVFLDYVVLEVGDN